MASKCRYKRIHRIHHDYIPGTSLARGHLIEFTQDIQLTIALDDKPTAIIKQGDKARVTGRIGEKIVVVKILTGQAKGKSLRVEG